MRIDSVSTTASFSAATKIGDAVKKTGKQIGKQGERTFRQGTLDSDRGTSQVNMATAYAVTPVAKTVASQTILRPGIALAREGVNYYMQQQYAGATKKAIDNFANSKGIYGMENVHNPGIAAKTGASTANRISESTLDINKTVKSISPTNSHVQSVIRTSIQDLNLKSSGRGLSHYIVDHNTLNISGTGGVQAANDYFKMIKSHSRGLDPELKNIVKQGHRLTSLTTTLENTYTKWSSPVNFARSGFRLATMNMQQNETVRGARLIEPLTMFKKVPGKVLNATINIGASIARNNIIRFQTLRRMRANGGWAYNKGFKAKLNFYRTTKQRVINSQTRSWLKNGVHSLKEMNPIKRAIMRRREDLFRNFLTRVFGKNNPHLNAFFRARDLIKNDQMLGKAGKKMYKKMRNALFKDALSGTRAGSKVLSVARSVTKSPLGKFAKGVKKVTKKVTKTVTKPFRWLKVVKKKILKKLRNSLVGKAVTTVVQAVSGIFTGIVGALALFLIFIIFIGLLADIEKEFGFRDSRNYLDERGRLIFETLEECHDEQVAELEEMQATYGAADINYANGSKENYKELYCMIQTASQYDSKIISSTGSKKEYKDFIKVIYKETHKINVSSYAYTDESGETNREAAHIMVTIFRDDMPCYAALSDYEGGIAGGGDAGIPVPDISGECSNSSWSSVYSTVKSLIAESGATYSQEHSQVINVTDASGASSYTVRQDCSGYVYACIRVYQHMMGFPLTEQGSSHSLGSTTDIPGFTKLPFDVNNLQIGDIIVKPGEHTEIFAGSQGGTVYAYSNGCTQDMRVAGATRSVNISSYTYIWRCTGVLGDSNSIGAAGGAPSATNISTGPQKTMMEVTGSHLNDIPLQPKNFEEYAEYMSNSMYILGMSNMSDVVFNEKTGNQDGYEIPLLATVNAAKQNGFFTKSTFDDTTTTFSVTEQVEDTDWKGNVKKDKDGKVKMRDDVQRYPINQNHIPKAGGPSNSADFIRWVMARHGVTLEFYEKDCFLLTHGKEGITGGSYVTQVDSARDLMAGDVVWYLPTNEPITKKYKQNVLRSFPSTGSYEINANIETESIPMLYLGNGQLVAFSRDVLAKSEDDYTNSAGEIRTYKFSDLNKNRIVRMYHYQGYTINPVYGYNDFFAGWTDNKISEYLEIENGPQWNKSTGFKYTNHEGEVVDYSDSYHEEYFDTNENTYTADWHDQEFRTEMLNLGLKYYDQYGILPSVLYSHAAASSNYRSTEESLKGFNIFGKIDNSENGLEVAKYSYDADGKMITTYQKYKQYGSIEEAVLEWLNSYNKSGTFAESFSRQISTYSTGNTPKDTIMAVYNRSSSSLDNWDSSAVDKNNKQNAVIKEVTEITNNNYVRTRECTQAQYEALKGKKESLEKSVNEFEKWFRNHDTDPMFGGCKNSKNEYVLAVAHAQIDEVNGILEQQKAYLESEAKKTELRAKEDDIKNRMEVAKKSLSDALKAVNPSINIFGNNIVFLKNVTPTKAQYDAIVGAKAYYWFTYCDAKDFYRDYGNQEGIADKVDLELEKMTLENVNNWLSEIEKANPSLKR